jgi:hypothetical protein
VRGEPKYVQTQNTIRVTISAYATQKDIDDVSPHTITIKNFIYSNPDLPMKDIKQHATDAFILEAISRKKPSVRDIKQARKLALEVDIISENFDIKTLDYTISGRVTYIPAFLRHHDSIKDIDSTSNITTPKKTIKKQKKDFYGTWSGFLMRKDGYSSSVEIKISSFSQATILYKTLHCGGNLILKEKNTQQVVFKQKLTFGEGSCKNNSIITLQKVTPKSLIFIENDNSSSLFNGRVYLVE